VLSAITNHATASHPWHVSCRPTFIPPLYYAFLIRIIFTARRSYSIAVLEVVILFVCLSHACFVTKPMHCGYFDATRNGNHSCFLTPTVVGGRLPFRMKFVLKVTHPFEKRPLLQIFAYNVSTVTYSEKVYLFMTTECVSHPQVSERVVQKAIFCFFNKI